VAVAAATPVPYPPVSRAAAAAEITIKAEPPPGIADSRVEGMHAVTAAAAVVSHVDNPLHTLCKEEELRRPPTTAAVRPVKLEACRPARPVPASVADAARAALWTIAGGPRAGGGKSATDAIRRAFAALATLQEANAEAYAERTCMARRT